jgi:hypothetical protein
LAVFRQKENNMKKKEEQEGEQEQKSNLTRLRSANVSCSIKQNKELLHIS